MHKEFYTFISLQIFKINKKKNLLWDARLNTVKHES